MASKMEAVNGIARLCRMDWTLYRKLTGKTDYKLVFHEMRLANGTLFLMLITLFVPDPRGVEVP